MAVRLAYARMQATGMAAARKVVTRATRRTDNRSAVLCPVDTGLLRATRRSNVRQAGTSVIGEVAYTADYAAAVHNGRRALTIRSKSGGPKLKFTVGGRTVYTRVVRQPARKGRPFLTTALREVAAQEGLRYSDRGR
jgi:hypothetical protein